MSDVFRRAYTNPLSVGPSSMVASAEKMTGSLLDHLIQNRQWQREAWDFYHAMGEFWYGVTWLSNACSRVRLVAAKKQPGGDEPEVIDPDKATGADAEVVRFVEELGGGVGGRSAILKSLAVQLSVPGEGYVVGEQRIVRDGAGVDKLSAAQWSVKSSDELRRRSSADDTRKKPSPLQGISPNIGRAEQSPFEVQVEEGRWRPLEPNSLVCRIWQPDEQYSWRAVSAALPALPILRELDLINRRILAELVSRIAMNGMLTIPTEATFPVRPEFADAADPFIEELIDTAAKAIKTPGSASAAIPMPIRVPAEFIDKITHIKFSEYLDPKLMEARDRTIKRLATTLNMPSEVLLGIADVNHWTAWQIDESGIKIHISPIVEVMCSGLTMSYLQPMIETSGISIEDATQYVIWYDISELTTHPDLSQNGKDAYDRGELSGTAYRREAGFSEDDAPDDNELKQIVLLRLALAGNTAAIGQLFPDLEEAMAPTPPPGYDPETGRPLAPEPPPGTPAQVGNQQAGPAKKNTADTTPGSNGRVPTGA